MTRRSLLAAAAPLLRGAVLPAPFGAVPSPRQLRWHEMETYAFLHFTINTFTDKEWGYGDESPELFQPAGFDAGAICEALRDGGMRGVILTCKHHDGFCLWPTKTTRHSVSSSPWRGGKGDVVRMVSEAARRCGLRFGVYLSPWDRNHAAYGTPEYVQVYRRQLRELLTGYGEIFEVWHDGANGGDGYYGGAREKRTIDKSSYYGWPETWELVRKLQPQAVIFSDVGPDLRWVGNESGFANETCWATYDPVGADGGPASPGNVLEKEGGSGHRRGKNWMPAECDVSIRPGWFWHEKENPRVKTPAQLMDLYFKSVGRGGSFLLNVPPDRRGLVHPADVASLREFGRARQRLFERNLAAGARIAASSVRENNPLFAAGRATSENRDSFWLAAPQDGDPALTIEFPTAIRFDVIRLREYLPLGQRIDEVVIEAATPGGWEPVARATSIGSCRLIRLDRPRAAAKIRVRFPVRAAEPAVNGLGFFLAPL